MSALRPLFVNTYDARGGAARAAWRLLEGLRRLDMDPRWLSLFRTQPDPAVLALMNDVPWWSRQQIKLARNWDKRPLRDHQPRSGLLWWSFNRFPTPLADVINRQAADVVHLHWLGDAFLPLTDWSKIAQPLVWTLHDMWAFTGGCHTALGCDRYRRACGRCPLLNSSADDDITARTLTRKKQHWANLELTLITPSRWLADCARQSALFAHKTVEVIPYGIDTERFKPIDRAASRAALNLPPDKPLLLFGASGGRHDPVKGFDLLRDALHHLKHDHPAGLADLTLVSFGDDHAADEWPYPLVNLGVLRDDVALVLAYSAADVFVAPSRQDNFPNTVLESLACGTPVIAFDVGGMPDMIAPGETGDLAPPEDVAALARHLAALLRDDEARQRMSHAARAKVLREFEFISIARRYRELYQRLSLT